MWRDGTKYFNFCHEVSVSVTKDILSLSPGEVNIAQIDNQKDLLELTSCLFLLPFSCDNQEAQICTLSSFNDNYQNSFRFFFII